MGDEAYGRQLIAGAAEKNAYRCACGEALYEHSITRAPSGGGYLIGACEKHSCPCSKFRNPNYDPSSIPTDVWTFTLKRKGLL